MRFLFKAHCTKLSKNAFFTKSALIKIIKTYASYSKRTVQKCKRTRSLLKVHLLKSLKHALLTQSGLYKIVMNAFFTKSALIRICKHALLIQSALYKIVKNASITESALIKIIKRCASYTKRTVQNCKERYLY